MRQGSMRRFHFLAVALLFCFLLTASPFGSTGTNDAAPQSPPPQTGRYIYSSAGAGGNGTELANHCVGISFQKCCQYERDHLPGLWIFIYAIALLYVFLAVAVVCDDYFVPSLELLSERLDLSEDVAGATFMAAGSSAPELFTSLASVTAESDVGVGTIVGSAVFNILVIIALTAALTNTDLHLDWRPLVRDSAFYGLSIIIFLLFVYDGEIQWYESVVMLILYITYCIVMKFNQKLLVFMAKLGSASRVEADVEAPVEAIEDTESGDTIKALPSADGTSPNPGTALPPVRQGFAEDAEAGMGGIEKSQPSVGGTPKNRSHSSRSRSPSGSTQKIDGEEKSHFKHHNKSDGKVRSSLMRRASEIGDIDLKKLNLALPETKLSDFIEDACEFEVKQIAFDTAAKDHHPIIWMLFSGVIMVDRPEMDTDKSGILPSLLYGYEYFVYILSIPIYFLCSHSIPECSRLSCRKYYVASFLMSIAWIAGLTIAMVILVEKMGCILGLSLFLMGLFLVAAGTSIPDAMSSILVARDGFADMAVSNAIGSNIFDINLGLGLPFMVKAMWQLGLGQKPTVNLLTEVERAKYEAAVASGTYYMVPHVQFGLILLGILVMTLSTFVFFKFRLSRPLGISFFGMYVVFVIYGLIKEFVCYEGSGISC